MSAELASIDFCRKLAGLAPHEILLGVTPRARHARILAKYRGARRSPAMARVRIVADLRAALARGARVEAADLLLALRQLLAQNAGMVAAAPLRRRPSSRPRPAAQASLRSA